MVRIKICGLRRDEDIEAVNELCPEYVGFVFADSKRKLSEEEALRLKRQLKPHILTAGVFVNDRRERIVRLCREDVIDLVQLHGDEDPEYMKALQHECRKPVIKAVRVKSARQIREAEELPCDYLLLDTYQPSVYGGSGKTFDWSMIPKLSKPYFLAGGLNAGNVQKAMQMCRPYAVDVSSSAETEGWKDKEKMRQIITAVRNADTGGY